jgi:adenine specific DNA methylase Mod
MLKEHCTQWLIQSSDASFKNTADMQEFDTSNKEVPNFEVYTTTIKHSFIEPGKEKQNIVSEAIKIVTSKETSEWLTTILVEATSESKWTTGIFVPFNWKRRESQTMFHLLD